MKKAALKPFAVQRKKKSKLELQSDESGVFLFEARLISIQMVLKQKNSKKFLLDMMV